MGNNLMTNFITDDITSQTKQALAYPQALDYALAPEFLAERFMRRLKQPEKIAYEFTHDPGLLHQYYQLREDMFIRVWGLEHFTGQRDGFDKSSQILVAKRGLQCIGGVRFSMSTPSHPHLLPMEGDDLSLSKLFPELNLAEC